MKDGKRQKIEYAGWVLIGVAALLTGFYLEKKEAATAPASAPAPSSAPGLGAPTVAAQPLATLASIYGFEIPVSTADIIKSAGSLVITPLLPTLAL